MVDIWRKCYRYWLFLYKYVPQNEFFEYFGFLFQFSTNQHCCLLDYQGVLFVTELARALNRRADENLDDDLI